MFAYLSGILAAKSDSFAIIDVGGVGYKVYSSASCLDKLPPLSSNIKMFTYLHLREDVMDLYGFTTQEELSMFELLMSVSGVGPKAALSILSTVPPSSLALAIISGDSKVISRAPGVGNKLAQRIILELKDKIKDESLAEASGTEIGNALENEAVSALMVLGYSAGEAQRAVSSVEDKFTNIEDIVKEALKVLMKAR